MQDYSFFVNLSYISTFALLSGFFIRSLFLLIEQKSKISKTNNAQKEKK
jgi:hypothetical protein